MKLSNYTFIYGLPVGEPRFKSSADEHLYLIVFVPDSHRVLSEPYMLGCRKRIYRADNSTNLRRDKKQIFGSIVVDNFEIDFSQTRLSVYMQVTTGKYFFPALITRRKIIR